MSNIKLRLKNGRREIEIEGAISDVNDMLEKWWRAAAPADDEGEEEDEDDGGGGGDSQGGANGRKKRGAKPRRKAARQRVASPAASGNPEDAFDANAFANAVKGSAKFAEIEKKVILGKASNYDKLAFVHWFHKKPLTSGDVQRALASLGVKVALPRISETLSRNITDFFTNEAVTAGGKPKYTMTSPASAKFEQWFNADAAA